MVCKASSAMAAPLEGSPWVRLVGIGEYKLELQNVELQKNVPTLIRLQPCREQSCCRAAVHSILVEKSEPQARSCNEKVNLTRGAFLQSDRVFGSTTKVLNGTVG